MTAANPPASAPSAQTSRADSPRDADAARTSHFIRQAVDSDLEAGQYARRVWSGKPGPAVLQLGSPPDAAPIRTRFPPEPNGYLHIGHAKSICLNFGLALDYAGRCHMRFDDTNPVKEDQEYVDGILDTVRWLGFTWDTGGEDNLYFASDYFGWFYEIAEHLVGTGHAYVDSQPADEMRARRGTLTEPGTDSPFRGRSPEESLALLREMRAGAHAEGTHVLRAKIDMASPNVTMRDPVLYRIRFAHHHRTGDAWCIYPMYDFAHPLSDALENVTHSLCTLEFEDHRPLYDWLLERAAEGGFFQRPLPRQIEFARLNMTYTVTSKRKLQELVQSGSVDGWDDPRMPTIVALRRRGYTPESIRLFAERIGVSKAHQWVDPSVLEQALRDDLDAKAARAFAVLDPLRLELVNFPETLEEPCTAPVHPHHPDRGLRHFPLTRELWIEREDFQAQPQKGFFRLFPGNKVRLKHGFVIECTGFEADADGRVTKVLASYFPDSKSGTPGADGYKVKGNIHWVSARHGVPAEVRMYERLFLEAHPDAGGRDYRESINPQAKRIVQAILEPGLATAGADARFQFERHGYFVADRIDHRPEAPVFNLSVTLKDSWGARK
ncbi:MAG: glutamine--tRNA ligase/YqeY domain fusion protein [Burkholderiales bacterium]|nr:MAG: glutamine--tRNA ligase/YqeY domain fusion protein [Burkholderiales bacterium]